MITLFVILTLLLAFKIIHFAVKAAWGLTKGILFGIGFPILLLVLFVTGLVTLAIPLLVLGLLGAFLWPILKGV